VVRGALDAMTALRRPQHLGGIWLAALGLAALADQAERFALARDDDAVGVARAAGRLLLDDARARAAHGRPRLAVLGPEGRAWLARAEAEAARLRGETDPDRWSAVVSAFGFGHVYEQARSRLRRAQALAAGGDRGAAAAELVAARAVAVRLAARPLRDAVDALARRARLDLGAGIAPSDGVLTRREHEVILLVAEGLTNRQIGQQLFISAKTASVHVSNVLAKLGVSGRAEAVDVAHRRGLLGG
jgi:DNA-binding CsgD family transcriptional regulator